MSAIDEISASNTSNRQQDAQLLTLLYLGQLLLQPPCLGAGCSHTYRRGAHILNHRAVPYPDVPAHVRQCAQQAVLIKQRAVRCRCCQRLRDMCRAATFLLPIERHQYEPEVVRLPSRAYLKRRARTPSSEAPDQAAQMPSARPFTQSGRDARCFSMLQRWFGYRSVATTRRGNI